MGFILDKTPEMGNFDIEVRNESFILYGEDKGVGDVDHVELLTADIPKIRAALDALDKHLGLAEPHEAVCQAVATGNEEDCDCKPRVEPNAIECMHPECGIIYRVDKEDLKGDLCANCGEPTIRRVRIEVVQ